MIVSFVAPGYSGPELWNPSDDGAAYGPGTDGYSNCLQLVQQVIADCPAVTHITIQTTYNTGTPNSWASTSIVSTGAVSAAGITNMTMAAHAEGLGVILKPHISMGDNTTQTLWLPGMKMSTTTPWSNSSTQNGTYSNGSNVFSSVSLSLTNAVQSAGGDVGKRICTPSPGHTNEIPNSGYTNYGQTAPAFTTIASVTSATAGTLSANAEATSTTGRFVILWDDNTNPSTAPSWNLAMPAFVSWLSWVEGVCSAAALGGGFDIVNLFTEHDWLTRFYPEACVWIIDSLAVLYPSAEFFVQTGEGLTYQNDVPAVLQNVCSYIGVSCYPTVGSSAGGDNVTNTIIPNWVNAVSEMEAWSTAVGQQVIWGEVGARSIVGAGHSPASTGFAQGVNPASDQANFVTGMLAACSGQSWWAGFCWWTWYFVYAAGTTQGPATTPGTMDYIEGAGSGNNGTYAPKEAAQAVFAQLARFVGTPGNRARIT